MGANLFDILFIVVLGFSAWQGFNKGLIATAASLAVLLLGVWAAIKFAGPMAGWLSSFIHLDQKYLKIIGFAAVFMLVAIIIGIVSKIIEGIVDVTALSVPNKVFGSAFSMLKTAFIWSILIAILNVIPFGQKVLSAELKDKSLFYTPVSKFAPAVFNKLNFEDTYKVIEEKVKQVEV